MAKRIFFIIPAIILTFYLWGCTTIKNRQNTAVTIAQQADLLYTIIQTDIFSIASYYRITTPESSASIYIEGDGLAWINRHRPSQNPTPTDPFALRLAAIDPGKNVIYIARPCQYTSGSNWQHCRKAYWTGWRFSEAAIQSINQALDFFVNRYALQGIHLNGYSGGGAIAVLIAARRDDILSLRTYAGNLDHDRVNSHHNVDLLSNSLNPVDYATNVQSIPQEHFIGSNDQVIPFSISEHFLRAMDNAQCAKIIVIKGADHFSGWNNQISRYIPYHPFSCK